MNWSNCRYVFSNENNASCIAIGVERTALIVRTCRQLDQFILPGASIPLWDHDAFLPCFRFPPISETFSDFLTHFYNVTFPRKIYWLSSAKISDDLFLSSTTNFEFPPCPIFKISPLFYANSPAFFILYVYFPPLLWPWCIYASPNARTGRPCILLRLH